MKLKYLFKTIPLLSTFLLILLLTLTNQKQYTKLKILIWDTPKLALGTYLAISAGSGFILSFILTSNLANINQPKLKKVTRYTYDSITDQSSQQQDDINNIIYDNTLIERDIKDPSPTIKANFRIIGNVNNKNTGIIDDNYDEYDDSNITEEIENPFIAQNSSTEYENQFKSKSNDWNDDSFESW